MLAWPNAGDGVDADAGAAGAPNGFGFAPAAKGLGAGDDDLGAVSRPENGLNGA
jgi:hypothetical protein